MAEQPPVADSCPRCRGLLVEERFLDMKQGGFMWGTGWRCVNCGNSVVTALLDVEARDNPSAVPFGEVARQRTRPAAA